MTIDSRLLSRREFLKLGGLGLAGLFVPPYLDLADLIPEQQGRGCEPQSVGYDRPPLESMQAKVYWRDMVLPISEARIGVEQPAYNRVWYRIGEEGYAVPDAVIRW